jgi:uncharacterized membrane protein YoaK (UPF0700 family)
MVRPETSRAIEARVPTLLSLNGGYVDTMSFIGLGGLFAAHVTGNFVTLGAALVTGTTGVIAKLVALPLFCVVVMGARFLGNALRARQRPVLRTMLVVKLLLLILAAGLAVWLGPFRNGDSAGALLTGMTLVSAMAIQNAAHRVHFPKSPPSTLMTGTTTQIMLDLADVMQGQQSEGRSEALARIRRMSQSVLAFAVGCAAAALCFGLIREWSFFLPPCVALLVLVCTPYEK